MQSPRIRSLARRIAPGRARAAAYELLLRPEAKPPMDTEAAAILRRTYRDDAEETQRILDRPVPWLSGERACG